MYYNYCVTTSRYNYQRWSPRGRPWPRGRPRGHILKSLALASKVKSLASRPQVLENWPVLGSRTARFVKILWSAWKIFWKTFFSGDRLKNFCEDLFFFFFLESTCALWPWSLALASSIPVLGLESVCPRKGCPWPWPRIFFLCPWPWPWPRALCPRLHLWQLLFSTILTFTNDIIYLAWSYKIEPPVSLWHALKSKQAKKAHKILISQIALKLQS